jgi:AcrR family transcriptional regulator
MGVTQVDEEVDGRRLRRDQNREAVIDALLALFGEGVYEPSTNEIAERAGLSPRSLFRYFEDLDDLHRAAAQRQLQRARPLLDLGVEPGAPTATKIDHLVQARLRLYEEIAPAARATRVCAHRHAVLARELRTNRTYLRNQMCELFAPELAGAGAGLLPALDVLCSFESYELLREAHGLSRAKIATALRAALTTLLDAPKRPR